MCPVILYTRKSGVQPQSDLFRDSAFNKLALMHQGVGDRGAGVLYFFDEHVHMVQPLGRGDAVAVHKL